MSCNPQVLLNRNPGQPKISIILIDWGVRESFHSLHYLNQQTVDRRDYELIWLEFYDRKPQELKRLLASSPSVLDKWLVLGYPDEFIFHKHRLYNLGLLAATGEVCVICDSDAVFRPTFIANLIRAFEETPKAVVHLDEVRNDDRRFYPFHYPTIAEIQGPGCINWQGLTTCGLTNGPDRIHRANYGACLAARRRDLLAIGGADEHLDYLGYICGPYDMTFRLVNYFGRPERWLADEYLYHVWHPNASGSNTDFQGPHDGRGMSLRALDARASFRVKPYLPNPLVGRHCLGNPPDLEQFLAFLRNKEESAWRRGAQPTGPPDYVYWVERDYLGCNIFVHAGRWYALNEREKIFHPHQARRGAYRWLLQAETFADLQGQIHALEEEQARRAGRLAKIRRRLLAQPLHRLPVRAWRKSCRLLASLWPAQSPWRSR